MSFTLLVTESMSDKGMDWLRSKGVTVKYGRGIDPAILVEDLQGCQAVIARLAVLSRDVLEKAADLKVIARHGAGVDSVDVDYCREHGITVLRNVGTNSVAVAEHAVTLIMSLAKKIKIREDLYKSNQFDKGRKVKAIELQGKTLGLVGIGHIGSITAGICKNGLGMNVIAYDPYVKPGSISGIELVSSKKELFSQADFISVHVPATPETKNSIGESEFACMKPTAFFINTARGTIVDEAALIRALQENRIAGAGLDVTVEEPTSMDNPLFGFENVIMTPHNAGSSEDSLVRASMAAARGCYAVINGLEVEEPAVVVK
ncbi:MAG: hydroxyacid dehydrogenase [Spirochaetales bacterium]|nr:hydroxyacid dehydrogenase [Spirochaetales bacterium]